MEAIIFCGIQATGKTTFFTKNFLKTHTLISLDLLNTRNKELKFMEVCFLTKQPFVIDNTNPTKTDREKYISLAKANKFKVKGYYFQSKLSEAIIRNNQRKGAELIPEIGIKGTFNKLEIPSYEEGFEELYFVEIQKDGFIVKDWKNEI